MFIENFSFELSLRNEKRAYYNALVTEQIIHCGPIEM